MADITNTAPAFVVILAGEVRPQAKSIALQFSTADRRKFGIELSAAVAPATITAIVGLLGQLSATLPEEERPSPQVLKTVGMTLAMNERGEVALVWTLEGGAELTLEMPTAELPKLRDQIAEALQASDPSRRN